ncbi:MAG TPA: amidase [Rhodothermia bacterium]
MSPDNDSSDSRPKSNRRDFLKRTALTTAAAAASPMAFAAPADPRHGLPPTFSIDFELDELEISDLAARMASGEESARSITEKYLARIEETNLRGPELRAVIETNPDALRIADELDAERTAGGPRGPLHGIPILLKDNIGTADRMTTTAGSYALEGSIPSEDSFVAQRLRAAGAVLLGKANLSEWANFRSTHSTGGWSGRGGLCRNPYALDRNACGSSTGSGVAVSANLCAAAIGTETDGSVVCPSSIAGIVGIKPTVGLIGRSGIIPLAHSQDTAGPMARTVADATILLGALTGLDPRDEATGPSEPHIQTDYTQFLDPDGLKGARIGAARKYLGRHPEVDRIFEHTLESLREAGAAVIDPADLPTHGTWGDAEGIVLRYEFKADINNYLKSLGPLAPAKTLEDLIRFNEEHADLEMPYFRQELFHQSQEKGPLTDQEYLDALETCRRLTRAEGIDAVMNEHSLDAIVAPTTLMAWTNDLIQGGHRSGGSSSAAAVSGYPSITVPSGYVFGLPVGLLFFGRPWSEGKLISLAYGFEQTTRVRRKPEFLPTADLALSNK